mgnify:CR=1 FL=1|tara:strand:+ start:193 stop:378 length:186 start_codon:yes stop_codon:yes gene_type:complete
MSAKPSLTKSLLAMLAAVTSYFLLQSAPGYEAKVFFSGMLFAFSLVLGYGYLVQTLRSGPR